jgi:hypothetical protein
MFCLVYITDRGGERQEEEEEEEEEEDSHTETLCLIYITCRSRRGIAGRERDM